MSTNDGWDVSLTRPPKTDRDLWAESSYGMLSWLLTQQSRRQDVALGLRALAAAWFDEYEDETDLPEAFHAILDMAESTLGDIDLPIYEDDE